LSERLLNLTKKEGPDFPGPLLSLLE
jgi:hypothetical protein